MTRVSVPPIVYTILFVTIFCQACPDFESSGDPSNRGDVQTKPKLILRVDEMRNGEKYVKYLNENVALVNKTGTINLRLDCFAPYPIDMYFSGHLTNQQVKVKTFRKEFGSADHPKSCFLINATMESYQQITGNYTCVSVERPKLSASYYIFVSPHPPGVILTRGQNITLQPKAGDSFVIFPCAVSHPDVHVQLQRGDETLDLSKDLTFDAKIGFRMKFNIDNKVIFGKYTCRTELSRLDEVRFTLQPPKSLMVRPSVGNIRLEKNDKLNISCYAAENFAIDFYPKTIPVETKKVVESSSPRAYYKYVGNFVSKPLSSNFSGYVSCKTNSSKEVFQWNFLVADGGTKLRGQLDRNKIQISCPNISDVVVMECSNSVECRMNACIRKDSECHSSGRICENDKSCIPGGILQCLSKTPMLEVFFSGFPNPTLSKTGKTKRYVNWKEAEEEELLQIYVVGLKKTKSKQTLHLACRGSNFVFSSGFKWSIIYKNGTKITVKSQDDGGGDILSKNLWGERKSILESTLMLPYDMASSEVTKFECQAPIWNSWEWMSQTISMKNIKSSVSGRTSSASTPPAGLPVWVIMLITILTVHQMVY